MAKRTQPGRNSHNTRTSHTAQQPKIGEKHAALNEQSISSQKAIAQLESTLASNPALPGGWIALASHALSLDQHNKAHKAIDKAVELSPQDANAISIKAAIFYSEGNIDSAIAWYQKALTYNPAHVAASHDLALIYHRGGKRKEALQIICQAVELSPNEEILLRIKLWALSALHQYTEAKSVADQLSAISKNPDILNDAGNLYRDIGLIKLALERYAQAIEISPNYPTPFSNYFTLLHYLPDQSQEDIYTVAKRWKSYFSTDTKKEHLPAFKNREAKKKIRIGFLSDGFRNTPVGQMITSALENIDQKKFELIAYTTNDAEDHITHRLKNIFSKWSRITQLYGDKLAKFIRDDEIDILIDLAGHNNGNRISAIIEKPSPIIIKWVGGLINTTGIDTIDYLISDQIETPDGVDKFYTEKIIRMPDDYICYLPPSYTPSVNTLPAIDNGFITFGCFNNPTKINETLIREWSKLLEALPESRIFLKSFQYNNIELRQRIESIFVRNGITSNRILFEGSSPHRELLESYQKVDIALDSWPYSGGLTTCEALLMGVPVVTLPGPTFAGRHSATHLHHAGLSELITQDWDEYRERAIELVSDLDSLSHIRAHLREVLQQSPVCNAERFADHLENALSAIWQRHLEGKAPAALNFNDHRQAVFAGEDIPAKLYRVKHEKSDSFFSRLEGKIIAIDHGAQLFDAPLIKQMLDQNVLELIAFDPASHRLEHSLRQTKGVHYYPNVLLGNGSTVTLYACQKAKYSGTLKPLDVPHLPKKRQEELSVLAELPINTLALDTINELPRVDWLVLDGLNNCIDILEHGSEALKDTLLIQADIAFQPSHENQPSFSDVSKWAMQHGFRFYHFNTEENRSPIPQDSINHTGELVNASALFIPSHERMATLSESQCQKLAFIIDTAYNLDGLCFEVLGYASTHEANQYIQFKAQQRRNKKQLEESNPDTPPPASTVEHQSHTHDSAPSAISIPQLTLPDEEAKHLREVYSRATSILEYGSGGSTILASQLEGKHIFTVENDLMWAHNMRHVLEQEKYPSPAIIHSVDVGETGAWARPQNDEHWREFHTYPLSVWDREDFIDPDVILIDGRFRVACFVAAVMKIRKPTTILFDDYGDRDYYHEVEKLAKPVAMIGRMAHFELTPCEIPKSEMTWMIASFNQVTYANCTRR